jgi:hypothetical protein
VRMSLCICVGLNANPTGSPSDERDPEKATAIPSRRCCKHGLDIHNRFCSLTWIPRTYGYDSCALRRRTLCHLSKCVCNTRSSHACANYTILHEVMCTMTAFCSFGWTECGGRCRRYSTSAEVDNPHSNSGTDRTDFSIALRLSK